MDTIEDINQQTGRRIKLMRKIMGISQAELADHVGVTQQQIQHYEAGKASINVGKLYKIAEKLDTDTTVLLSNCPTDTNALATHILDIEDSEINECPEDGLREFSRLLGGIRALNDADIIRSMKKLVYVLVAQKKQRTDED